MTIESIQTWIAQNPVLAPWVVGGVLVLSAVVMYLIVRYLIARSLLYVAKRTENKYDDIFVERLRPFRFAWIAPLLVIYYFAGLLPEYAEIIRQIVLFLMLWLIIFTVNSLLNAVNSVYESSKYYRGDSIQGWLDLVKIVLILVGMILSVSMFTGRSPLVLLSGLGAAMAILLLIFRDTILSFVASIQIQSNDLVNEGDWIEVPSYEADGSVLNISLHSVKIQNWDKTITVVPTYKLVEVPYKNWRGMEESGGRRIKRAVHVDLNGIRFCDQAMLERLGKIELLKETVGAKLAEMEQWKEEHGANPDDPLDGPQITNLDLFQTYATNYLKRCPDLHQGGEMSLLVHQQAPGPTGMPVEVYAFAKTVEWVEYERIQSEIIDHLVAAMPQFGLWVYQRSGTGAPGN